MPRGKKQAAIQDTVFLQLYPVAGKSYVALTANGYKHGTAKKEAYSQAFTGTNRRTVTRLDAIAEALFKKGELPQLWHRRPRAKKANAHAADLPAGTPLVTYHHDPSAQPGVYYTILIDGPDADKGEVAYVGKADGAFGDRLLAITKYNVYKERVPLGKSLIVQTRCLSSGSDHDNVVLSENWITRCWAILTCRLPRLHKIDKRSGKALRLHGLKEIDLTTLRSALEHLILVGSDHEVEKWKTSRRGVLDLNARLSTLLDSLNQIKDAVANGHRITRITNGPGGKGRNVKIRENTKLNTIFSNSAQATDQWLDRIEFTTKKGADKGLRDTAPGQAIIGSLTRPGTASGSKP